MKIILTITALLFAAHTYAGFTNHYQVNVNTGSRTAYGSFIGARDSADPTQYFYCAYVGTTANPYGICGARNSAGVSAYCRTSQAHHVEQIRGLSNESYIYMQWDASGNCTYIYSSTGSQYHQ